MKLWQTNPIEDITITHGAGCTVYDDSGKAYLDLLSGTWCNTLGCGHPRWVSAVCGQAEKLVHAGAQFMTEELDAGLAKLSEILPPELDRAVFVNTGSEGVELALKMARAATGVDGIGMIERGYYGATSYALALSEAGRTAEYLPALGKTYRLPAPDCRNCPMGCTEECNGRCECLGALEDLAKSGGAIAAVIFEPVIAGELLVPPAGYVRKLRELTKRCNALLISEEVTTGVGRTGRWFGFQHENIVPDILVIGKAIGAGLPVAAVVTTEDVESRCKRVMLRHVQSHQNDPFSGRIAATVISIMQDEHLVEQAAQRGEYLISRLNELKAQVPWIVDVRGRGLMVGVELHKDWASKGAGICKRLMEQGFIVNYNPAARVFRLFPPYIISTEEMESFVEAFKGILTGINQ